MVDANKIGHASLIAEFKEGQLICATLRSQGHGEITGRRLEHIGKIIQRVDVSKTAVIVANGDRHTVSHTVAQQIEAVKRVGVLQSLVEIREDLRCVDIGNGGTVRRCIEHLRPADPVCAAGHILYRDDGFIVSCLLPVGSKHASADVKAAASGGSDDVTGVSLGPIGRGVGIGAVAGIRVTGILLAAGGKRKDQRQGKHESKELFHNWYSFSFFSLKLMVCSILHR